MVIPESVVAAIEKELKPEENSYFNHAVEALNALNKITKESYCSDYMSNVINSLERLYKGFLKAATKVCEWYRLPSESFLTDDHDVLGVMLEIKENFPDVFPKTDRETWRDTKAFLRDLRHEYTSARYETYPTFEEFSKVLGYVNAQKEILLSYIQKGLLEENYDKGLNEDY